MTRSPNRFLGAAILVALSTPATAQNQINSDTTIYNNLCIGTNCLPDENYPNFGGTLMLKSERNSIHFIDESDAANGFPSGDWKLRANDDSNVGEDHFSIQDIDNGTTPFRIENDLPSNSFVMTDSGIGIGTAFPLATIHAIGPLGASLRLEQADQFGNGEWDLTGAATGFSVQDARNGTVPIFVSSTVPDYALALVAPNRVGMGTLSPETALHIKRDDNSGALLIEDTGEGILGQLHLKNNGITFFTLEDTSIPAGDNSGRAWNFQNQAGTFRVTTAPGGPGEIEMLMDTAGDMYIKGQLYTGTGGGTTTCASGCDRVFDADYDLPSIADHHAMMMENRHLPAVGPTPENGPFNLSQMTGGMLNELEKAHLYIAQLEARLAGETARNAAQEERLAEVESVLHALTEAR